MSYEAKVIADSVSPWGHRLTTMAVRLPRLGLAALDANQAFIRTSAAPLPISQQLLLVMEDPFVPDSFDSNVGEESRARLIGKKHSQAVTDWRLARLRAVTSVLRLLMGWELFQEHFVRNTGEHTLIGDEILPWLREYGPWLDSLVANDLPSRDQLRALNIDTTLLRSFLDPFIWQTVLVTATEWDDFFKHNTMYAETRPQLHSAALLMWRAYAASTPNSVEQGETHSVVPSEVYGDIDQHVATPFTWGEWNIRRAAARLYQRQGGSREWTGAMIDEPLTSTEFHGKLRGWRQLPGERS